MGFPIAARFAHPDAGTQGAQEQAAGHLEPGRVYMVQRLEVGGFGSRLFLDIPDGPAFGFNTVMFEPADADDVDGAIKWDDDDEPRPYAFTRDELVSALTRIEVRPVGGKVVAEWMADAIIQVLEEANDG